MSLVSGNIWCMWIFAGFPLGGSVIWEWGCRRRQFFGDLNGYFFGNFTDKASNIIWRYAIPLVGLWLIAKWMTLNDLERLFHVKIRFRPALCCWIDASFGAHCTNLNEDRPYYQHKYPHEPYISRNQSHWPTFQMCAVGSKRRIFSATECVLVVHGHSRSSKVDDVGTNQKRMRRPISPS